MSLDNLQRALSWVAIIIAAFVLVKFSIDFTAEMSALLAAPFWLLSVAALGVACRNTVAASGDESRSPLPTSARVLLLGMIPLGFLASSLDCAGLSLAGCAPFCSFIKTVLIPALAVGCAAYFFTGSRGLLFGISAMSFAPLVPHCVCFNVGNGWWIERIGSSPVCYAWGFVVSVISVSALCFGQKPWPSILVNAAIISGATIFFVSHHYFHFPW
ncbi:MAG TPA: hypothetical protein VJZ26_10375 [Blastocatellia bacterium]|nr:hypothetical protein [Blastocatellia bacterium]